MITVLSETTKEPLQLMGQCAGICYGTENLTDNTKNKNRALDCINSGHGRVMEYPQIYLVIDGYSARTLRQLYTHIGGMPTRLQASTRYIDYDNFDYIIPPALEGKDMEDNRYLYVKTMKQIRQAYNELIEGGISKEDAAMLLPLGMTTKVVFRTNLRQLIDMCGNRMCSRTYWEFRNLMKEISNALSAYSDEWAEIVEQYFKPKCEILGYCPERNGCGKFKQQAKLEVQKSSNKLMQALKSLKSILVEEQEELD